MKTTFVSTYALGNSLRTSIPRLQSELTKASTEVTTSRHADVGLALGNRTERTLSLRNDLAVRDGLIDSNGMVRGDLQLTQSTLTAMTDGASAFLNDLLAYSNLAGTGTQLLQSAQSALSAFIGFANTFAGGEYVFGGINNAVPPIADYSGAPKLALDTAFSTVFGLAMPDPQNDPAVAGITPAAMQSFLDNEFAALFADPAWTTDWSSASDTNRTSRISPSETIETSVNANEPALRKLAMAYAMVAELGTETLEAGTLDVVVAKARDLVGSAIAGLSGMQSRIGFAEQRVTAATARMTAEKDIVSRNITSLEGVDPIEAKVRFDTLSTQIEMSYALTTRILSLSILNYA